MLRKDIYVGSFYRVRDYEEMLADPKLKHGADGTIWYPRGHAAFTPDMRHLCGERFMSNGMVYGGSISIWNKKFRTERGYYKIEPWMVESCAKPYTGKTYEYGAVQDPDPDIDTEQIGLLFSDLFGNT